MTPEKLTDWWRAEINAPFVAMRHLVDKKHPKRLAPFVRFDVGYCSTSHVPLDLSSAPGYARVQYTVRGELEQEIDSPKMHLTPQQLMEKTTLVGGWLRSKKPELANVLEVAFTLPVGNRAEVALQVHSDGVPLRQDADKAVRVLCGCYEDVQVHPEWGVSVLDVVLTQGGCFKAVVPPGKRGVVYTMCGTVWLQEKGPLTLDHLVWIKHNLLATARCTGGRFLWVLLPGRLPGKANERAERLSPLYISAEFKAKESL